jgi:hypothetical protein
MAPATTWKLLVLWVMAAVPSTGLSCAVAMVLREMFVGSGSGFFGFQLGPSVTFLLSAGYGLAWALSLAIPHLLALRVWVGLSRVFGDTDTTRIRILAGMFVWALPQAILAGAAGELALFLVAWPTVALGLWLPRACLRALHPGVFNE